MFSRGKYDGHSVKASRNRNEGTIQNAQRNQADAAEPVKPMAHGPGRTPQGKYEQPHTYVSN